MIPEKNKYVMLVATEQGVSELYCAPYDDGGGWVVYSLLNGSTDPSEVPYTKDGVSNNKIKDNVEVELEVGDDGNIALTYAGTYD